MACVSDRLGSRGATGEKGINPKIKANAAKITARSEKAWMTRYLALHSWLLYVYTIPGVSHEEVHKENASTITGKLVTFSG